MPVDTTKSRENVERYVYARDNGHTDYLTKAKKCDDYFCGLQWEESVRKKLESQGKPVLTINLILATMATVMGERIENKADISFLPFKNGVAETAEALAKVYMQVAYANKMEWLEGDVADDGFITGRGYFDCRIGFDDQMKGEVDISYLNPKNVVIDPDAESYDPEDWKEVFVTKWMTADEIETQYNKADADILRARGDTDFTYNFDFVEARPSGFGGDSRFNAPSDDPDKNSTRRMYRVLERQFKKLRKSQHFIDPQTGDTRPVPDNWEPDRVQSVLVSFGWRTIERVTEQIRWRVTVDNLVLHDEWSPYKYFTVIPYFPFFLRGKTIGLVENLLSPQEQLNKASSQELHVVNTTANSGYKVKTGSLVNMDTEELEQRGGETGIVLEMDDINNIEKINPNTVPTGLERIAQNSEQHMKNISGVSDSKRGFDRADVAAKAIQAKQAAGSVNLAKPMDNLTRTRHILASRVLNLVQTYYVEERILQVTGNQYSNETENVAVNQVTPEGTLLNDLTLGEYSARVTTVPMRDTYLQSQFAEAAQMREKMGIRIPDEWIIENSHISRKAELIQAMKEANGGGDPSETELQMAQLEIEAKQVENALKKAQAEKAQADAALVAMRAEEVAQNIENNDIEGGGDSTDMQKVAGEMQLARQKAAAEISLQRERQAADLENQKQRLEVEIDIMRERARNEALIKRAQAAEQAELAAARQSEGNANANT